MKSIWRKQLIVCLVLGLLVIPIYFLDRALLSPSGGNWITLDFRGLFFWSYVTLVAIDVILSSIAVLLFPKAGALRSALALRGVNFSRKAASEFNCESLNWMEGMELPGTRAEGRLK